MPTTQLTSQVSPIAQRATECFVPPGIKSLFAEYRIISKANLTRVIVNPRRDAKVASSCFEAVTNIMKAVKIKLLPNGDTQAIVPKILDVFTLDKDYNTYVK